MQQTRLKTKKKIDIITVLVYLLVIAGAIVMVIPFIWMLSTAVKTQSESIEVPPIWIPKVFHFENFVSAWQAAPFATYMMNSVFVTVATTALQLFTSILAAFGFAKLNFKGKNLLFILLLATMMVPGEMLIIPNYVTLAKVGLINTYGALIIPWIASFFSVFALRQSFQSVPDSVYYSAKIDGSSDWRFLWRILVPMSRSSIVAVTMLQVIGSWNSFMWPLIVTNSDSLRTLPVGLQSFMTESGIQYPQLMAATTFVILPMAVLYLFLQKYIIAGISRSGLKG
ncbi:MAG: carbohydrate ABC transporter permease [Oenococcus sp.]|nr:carbohydrate ABC transporter permease [Oenococcus kitaharae]MCV3296196.1 carbohydrate ABC transporter permease [Oenococcus kitaharae]OEY84755.1 ABC transporter permease [Oenococcus kitaharae]OEY85038.1 ABC transporter permease [Oenococcus kitaharae]OEY85829.1 ABC transporter permease [Oenococcus kitaharae]